MNYIKQLLSLLSKKEKRKLLLVFGGVLVLGVLEIAGIGSIMPFLSVAANQDMVQKNVYLNWAYETFGFNTVESFLFSLGVGAVLFILISNIMKAVVTYVTKRYAMMRLHYLSYRLFKRYLYQPYTYFLDRNTSELLKNILGEVGTLINKALMPLIDMTTSIVVTVLIVVMLVVVDPILALMTFVVIGFVYGIIYIVVKRHLDTLGRRRIESNRLRFRKVSEALGGIKDVKVLGREDYFLNDFAPPSIENAKVQVVTAVIGAIPRYVLEVIAFGGMLLIVLYMMRTMGNFRDAVPVIGLYAFAAYRMIPSLQKIFANLAKLRTNLPVAELIHKNLGDWQDAETRIESINRLDKERLQFKDVLILDAISYSYPRGNNLIIKDQTFEIRKNTTVGLVGPTGCGKTTTVDIILGLLEPQKGRILVDGVEITSENVGSWQKQIGYVPQNIYLADNSIAKNIAFGMPEKLIDMEAVISAARIANIHDFIDEEMAMKYQTVVGERGIRLSGGQRQRIGIARALYNDPAILILDEATSSLDGLTEAAIMDAIHTLSHKKTIIIIAHRLSTVRECDEIFSMNEGVVIDRGTYRALLERNEQFRKIAELS